MPFLKSMYANYFTILLERSEKMPTIGRSPKGSARSTGLLVVCVAPSRNLEEGKCGKTSTLGNHQKLRYPIAIGKP